MATTSKICLKLLIDEKAKKVLFAEAGKDFVDFLFSLLEVPLGSIIGLLMEEGKVDSSSSVKIYESVINLDPSYIQPNKNKEFLQRPKPASSSSTTPSMLTNLLFQKQGCCNTRTIVMGGSSREVGYVKGVVTYMVMDEVKPMSTIPSISLLNEFSVKDVSRIKERTVEVDKGKALELMKALFDPYKVTVLTDLFIRKRAPPMSATD